MKLILSISGSAIRDRTIDENACFNLFLRAGGKSKKYYEGIKSEYDKFGIFKF
jgi:hypothetical protein